MKSRDFCYWLQGLFELQNPKALDEKQTDLIRAHLQMVFIHEIDPSFPQNQQEQLNIAHNLMGIYPLQKDTNLRC
jgi:hypothetical protein